MSDTSFDIVLYEPEIAYNTGSVGRTCVALGAKLWLVRPLGFQLDDRRLRRAGLDYWASLDWEAVDDWNALVRRLPGRRFWFFTKRAEKAYTEARFEAGDVLVFGSESRGLPGTLLSELEKGTGTFCLEGPSGAAHKRSQPSFPPSGGAHKRSQSPFPPSGAAHERSQSPLPSSGCCAERSQSPLPSSGCCAEGEPVAVFQQCLRIPIRPEARSLNLAVSVAVAAFEAQRQMALTLALLPFRPPSEILVLSRK